jgi:hypothetical protein
MHPTTLEPWATENYIPINATAAQVYAEIKKYYSDSFGSDISVTRDMFDTNGTNTTNATLCQRSVYNVTLKRLISGVSVSNVMATKSGTAASISFLLPGQVQSSGIPLTGKFKVQCVNSQNQVSYSNSARVGDSARSL